MFPRLRVFLSYAREDSARADALYDSLQAAGFEPWMDRRDIPEGAEWHVEINRGIRKCHAFLACLSHSSVVKSGVLAEEVDSAVQAWKRRPWWSRLMLLPVRFEECQSPANLSQLQWVDVFRDADWVRVERALRRRQHILVMISTAVTMMLALLAVSLAYAGYRRDILSVFRQPGGQPRVGITIWKLAPAAPVPGSKELLHETVAGGGENDWKPFRVARGSALQPGDHVRISIESGLDGYLYVVDREKRREGPGVGKLIFPTRRIRNGDNAIRPGAPVELPDQQDRPPYWTLKSSDPSYEGEMVTVLIVPTPLAVAPARDTQVLPAGLFSEWLRKWEAPLSSSENGQVPMAATVNELLAGNAGKTLTHEDPLPQMVYRRMGRNNGSIVVTFTLDLR